MTSEPRIDALYKRMHEIFSQVPEREKNTIVDISGPRMTIKFNRPKRYNAFTIDMYLSLSEAINKAQTNEKVKFIVLTGQGGNFSSGNDLTNFNNPAIMELSDSFSDIMKASSRFLKNVTQSIITSKKPIIALTEGKVIGFTFTMLALLDKVISVQNSWFVAPLVSSAQGPQLCASYTFPKIFGRSVAEQLVTFGKPVNCEYLQKFNFLEKAKTREDANKKLDAYLNKIDELQWYSYVNARRLYRQRQQTILLQVAQKQIQNLVQRWLNPNLLTYLGKHMQKMKTMAKL